MPEHPRQVQWNAMREHNSRPLPFWRKAILWAVAFAIVVVSAFLKGPGH